LRIARFGKKSSLLEWKNKPQHIVDVAYLRFISAILVLIDLSALFQYKFNN